MLLTKTVSKKITIRLLFAAVTFAAISLSRADGLSDLNKECFQQKNGRSCVKLGTTLWQTPTKRDQARAAFTKGCELKQESACTLKDMPAPSTAPEPVTINIPRGKALGYAANLSQTLATAEMEPYKQNGKTEGWRFKSIEPISIFRDLGFKPGDVILKVNNQKISSPNEAMTLLPALITGETDLYKIEMTRDKRTYIQTFQIID